MTHQPPIPACSPDCATQRPASERPFDLLAHTKAELLAELQRLSRERSAAIDTLKDATSELLAIPRWVRDLCQRPWVRRLVGRR